MIFQCEKEICSIQDIAARGGDENQVVLGALAAGTFEWLFESVSIGNFKSMKDVPVKGVKDFLMNIVKSSGVNATEEGITELANIIWDTATMGDISQWNIAVQQYMDAGYSQEDARKMVVEEMADRVLESAASGALMGFGFGAIGSTQSALQNRAGDKKGAASALETASIYNPAQAEEIRREGKTFRNLVAGFDIKVSEFFDRWKQGRKSHLGEKLEKLYMGKMPPEVKAEVANILGYEISERDFVATSDDVKHVYDKHENPNKEIEHGNIPLEPWMFDALPEVLTNPDSITPGHEGTSRKNSGKHGVLFSKEFSGGVVITVQYDNPGRGTMGTTTLYAKNKGATSELYAPAEADTSAVRPGRLEPAPIANTNITHPADSVNSGTKSGYGQHCRLYNDVLQRPGF